MAAGRSKDRDVSDAYDTVGDMRTKSEIFQQAVYSENPSNIAK